MPRANPWVTLAFVPAGFIAGMVMLVIFTIIFSTVIGGFPVRCCADISVRSVLRLRRVAQRKGVSETTPLVVLRHRRRRSNPSQRELPGRRLRVLHLLNANTPKLQKRDF